jgi:hypothetical protein
MADLATRGAGEERQRRPSQIIADPMHDACSPGPAAAETTRRVRLFARLLQTKEKARADDDTSPSAVSKRVFAHCSAIAPPASLLARRPKMPAQTTADGASERRWSNTRRTSTTNRRATFGPTRGRPTSEVFYLVGRDGGWRRLVTSTSVWVR